MADDPLLLKGISSIVNEQNVRPGLNLAEIEKLMANDSSNEVQDNTEKAYKNEMDRYVKAMGIEINDVDDTDENDNELSSSSTINFSEGMKPIGKISESNDSDNEYGVYTSKWSNDDKHQKTELDERTEEEQRHSQIQSVIKDMGGEESNVWSIEKEKEEDM